MKLKPPDDTVYGFSRRHVEIAFGLPEGSLKRSSKSRKRPATAKTPPKASAKKRKK